MKQLQKGFTLIELMIVVAIIGILAAVAIPAYQDYIARSQMSEAMTLLGGAKTPLAEYVADNGTLPAAITEVVGTVSGRYVSAIDLVGDSTNFALVATMNVANVNSAIQGKNLQMTTANGGRAWVCTTAGTGNAAAAKYLPAACR